MGEPPGDDDDVRVHYKLRRPPTSGSPARRRRVLPQVRRER